LTLPFAVAESLNGKPIPNPTVAYQSIVLNAKVDPALFQMPK
jgi:hypothetical protein